MRRSLLKSARLAKGDGRFKPFSTSEPSYQFYDRVYIILCSFNKWNFKKKLQLNELSSRQPLLSATLYREKLFDCDIPRSHIPKSVEDSSVFKKNDKRILIF